MLEPRRRSVFFIVLGLLHLVSSEPRSPLTNRTLDMKLAMPLTKTSLVKLLSSWMPNPPEKLAKRDGLTVPLHLHSLEPPGHWLQGEYCSFTEVILEHFRHYVSLPITIFSNLRGPNEVCDHLNVDKVSIELDSHQELIPTWLRDATLVGECPWQLVKRKLDDDMVPPEILEVNCLCNGFRCSEGGLFKCTPVSQEVKMWRSNTSKSYLLQLDRIRVTIGCVCAQRRSPEAGYVDHVESD
ncbi:uncharacterized protein LOC135209702 [Macrobrachium nipponense]|uniref:uncharacterized protein LOC135209702 n=1 Tax=Macrobrachium nipponense TaxID=159736 RepID=UPI0030C80D42